MIIQSRADKALTRILKDSSNTLAEALIGGWPVIGERGREGDLPRHVTQGAGWRCPHSQLFLDGWHA